MKHVLIICLCCGIVFSSCSQKAKQQSDTQPEKGLAFPSELGIGQTWNRSLTKRIGQIMGLEACHSGETSLSLPPFNYGESPYLVAELGIEMAKGLHAMCPVTGIDRNLEGDIRFRAAFERIIEESGVKTYDELSVASPADLRQEQEDHVAVALQACRESIVLLKNKGNVLPVDKSKQIFISLPHYAKEGKKKVLEDARQSDVITVAWDAESARKTESKIWLKMLCALGKPVILVLSGEQSFTIDPLIEQSVSAVIAAWFPKSADGELIGDAIRGDYPPGSRLTAAIYDTNGKLLYPMGHGLSYTTVAYSDLTLEPVETDKGKNIIVRFKVTNTGERASDEVALLYIQSASAVANAKDMRMEGFKRTHLKPGETKEIKFTVRQRNLEVIDQQMNSVVESGEYKVMLSGEIAPQYFLY